jgi:cyclase
MKKTMFFGAGNFIFERAKELRKNLTSAELVLWGYLKQSPLGCKFRRQHPLGIYSVDFYCHKLKLVIEVDGGIHSEVEVAKADSKREEIIRAEGLDVLRFRNDEIEKNLELVITEIENYINNKRKPL